MFFIKYNNYFIIKHYAEQFRDFIRKEKYRSEALTSARIEPFCKKYDVNMACFDGTRISPRKITQRNVSLFKYNNHLCLFWKSITNSFNQETEELKLNFKIVDNVVSDKHVKNFIKYESKPKKVQSPLTIIDVYDLETYNIIGAVCYCSCINI